MRCPSCGAEVRDDAALFCSRCGAGLGRGSAEATEKLQPEASGAGGRSAETADISDPPRPNTADVAEDRQPARTGGDGVVLPVKDFVDAAARSARSGGWPEAAGAAGVAFLALLCVGLLLVVAAKLDAPALGAGTNPVVVLSWIVMVGLAALGAPVRFGELRFSALPLGALLLAGAAIAWIARTSIERRGIEGDRARAVEGAKIGIPFGLLCFFAALLFRHRGGQDVVSVDPWSALFLGAFWSALFGALGGAQGASSLTSFASKGMAQLRARSETWHQAVVAALVMLLAAAVLSAGAGLLWIIVALARGAPGPDLAAADAAAGIVYLAAFLPNVLVAIIALSLGAPIDVGAQVTVQGRVHGGVEQFSLLDWGAGSPPWLAFALLAIPVVAGMFGGFTAHRGAPAHARPWEVLVASSAIFATALAVVAALGTARLGAGLAGEGGLALVAPNPALVLVLGFLWGLLMGFAGWKISESQG